MHFSLTFALAVSGSYANLQDRQTSSDEVDTQNLETLHESCILYTPDGHPDWSAPCNAIEAIVWQCMYGSDIFRQLNRSYSDGGDDSTSLKKRALLPRQIYDAPTDGSDDDDSDSPEQDPATQRTCICESQFFAQIQGCAHCYSAHGGGAYASEVGIDSLPSLSSSYCAASSTPTAGFADVFDGALSSASSSASTTAPISDPLANQTAVSLYFIASVTGTPAYIVAQPTASGTGGNGTTVSYTTSNIVSGQIAPTAAVNNEAKSSGGSGANASGASGAAGSGSSTGTSSAGAIETAVVKAGTLGIMGVAAAVVML